MIRGSLIGVCLAGTLLVWNPGPADAQRPRVSPFVAPGHWSLDAARRLHASGLAPRAYDPAIDPQPLGEIWRVFDAAADRSPLAAAYRARLEEEFEGLRPGDSSESALTLGMGRLGFGGMLGDGWLRVGTGNETDWSGPLPAPSPSTMGAGVDLLGVSAPVAAELRLRVDHDGIRFGPSRVTASAGSVVLWGGTAALGLRTADRVGLVLPQPRVRPGLGLHFADPIAVPWIGQLRFATSLTRAASNYIYAHPWVWAMRAMLSPHPRLDVALNRAVMLGGEGQGDLTLERIAYVLIGKHSGGFDNQVVSVSGRYRPPLAVPLEAYFEWGFEDSAGAWRDVPGIMAGVELPTLPFAPAASVGVSATWFEHSCCGNPIWYRNWSFRGGWADDGHLLGHPLGGNGRELRLRAGVDFAEARAQVRVAGFVRDRGDENVYAPDREGGSAGFLVDVTGLLAGGWQAIARGELERGSRGDGWWEGSLEAGLSATF